MGRIVHHAIVVTCSNHDDIVRAHVVALDMFGLDNVTLPIESRINGYWSFLIPPDGSKEGWIDSEHGDARRATFHAWVAGKEEDGSNPYDTVEVAYGEVKKPVVTVVNGHVRKKARIVSN